MTLAVVLILARSLALFWTAPAVSNPAFGPRLRVMAAALTTWVLGPMACSRVTVPSDLETWVWAIVTEVLVGGLLGLAAGLIIAGARQAGELVGAQAGLSTAALLDPDASEEMTPLGHLYGWAALGAFLAIDGPLRLVKTLFESLETWPVGEPLAIDSVQGVFGKVGESLALALGLAAPAAIALTMAGAALALMARSAPTLSIGALALPIRSALGLALAALGMALVVGRLAEAWRLALP